jgi:hypothetical protein
VDKDDDDFSKLPRTVSNAWLQAGLNKDNPRDFDQMVRILRRLVEEDDRDVASTGNRSRFIIGAVSAAAGTVVTIGASMLPDFFRWLSRATR